METGLTILAISAIVFLITIVVTFVMYIFMCGRRMVRLEYMLQKTVIGIIFVAITWFSGIGIGVGFWWTIIGFVVRTI